MKKMFLGAAAATLIASPILAAAPASAADRHGRPNAPHQMQNRGGFQQQAFRGHNDRNRTQIRYQQTYRPTYRTWQRGQRFDSRYASNYRVINDYRGYGLQAPPYGYQWRQSGNDAVLVALASGLIGAVIGGAIN